MCRVGTDPEPIGFDWIPDDPAQFRTSSHFDKRSRQADRAIDSTLAAEIIEAAEPAAAESSGWEYIREIDGARIMLACNTTSDGPDDELYAFAHTGYVREFTDVSEWLGSDRFTERQKAGEALRNVVNDHNAYDWWPPWVWEIQANSPVTVSEHRVSINQSDRSLHCHNCGSTFRSLGRIGKLGCVA